MRLSSNNEDIGYELFEKTFQTHHITVLLEGMDITYRCITADDDEQYVVLFDDPPQIKDDELQLQVVEGDVKIILTER